MPLPDVLRDAPVLWRPGRETGLVLPICNLTGYRTFRQCQTLWCWAAVMQALRQFLFGTSASQCRIVEELTGDECDCSSAVGTCDRSVRSKCNDTRFLNDEDLQTLAGEVEERRPSQITAELVCRHLGSNRPILALFRRSDEPNQEHYAGLTGLETVAAGRHLLEVSDPKAGELISDILWVPANSTLAIQHPDRWILRRLFLIMRSRP